ncbi:MAG TPA: glycosyltransferase [Pseudonocardia sp.]|jgi:hypothetical protein|uniref:glycosyltransferase n=1 Tax=Pseudonocardia sp. TaxID=60912 RepID=UPI002EDB94D4
MSLRPTPYRQSELPAVVPGEVVETPEPDEDRGQPWPSPDRTGPEHGPRIAILSLREVRPIADFGGVMEAEEVLRDALAAGLYRVMVSSPRFTRGPLHRPVVRRVLSSSRLARPYRIEHHQRHGEPADVLLVLAKDLRDASVLAGLPGWHELGDQVIMHISVVTEQDLRRYPELVVQLRRRVDVLFSGSEMPPLGHLRSERLLTVGVIPPLLDVLAFPPKSEPERTIDVFSPGQRPPAQHRLLQQWANSHDGKYQQDIGQLGAITSVAQHRRIFTTMATRSRVFLTNYDQFGHRRHAGAHREVGPRFYEAMAAGCALAGDLPVSSRQFGEYVAEAQPLQFPSDAVRLPSDVAAVLADPAESERLGRTARVAALRRNDVAHRWREMAELAGIPVSSGIEARIKQLAGVAETIAAGGAELPPAGPRGFPPFPPRQRDWRDETDPGGSAGGYRDPAFDRF